MDPSINWADNELWARAERAARGDDGPEEWVAVLEFAPCPGGPPLQQDDVEAVVEALREWHPVGLFHHERYAIQLQLSAPDPQAAFEFALTSHRDAARSAGIPVTAFVRAEIITLTDFENSEVSGPARELIVGPLTRWPDP